MDHNQTNTCDQFYYLLGKWFMNKSRSQNKQLIFQCSFISFLKKKMDKNILCKTINNVEHHLTCSEMVEMGTPYLAEANFKVSFLALTSTTAAINCSLV